MKLAIKIDVDTYHGTRDGVPTLCALLEKRGIPATFFFSLGPDNTGKALRRIFRKGFLKKCLRSNVAGNYGLKTLMYGTLLKAPNIGKLCTEQMRETKRAGFECGIHCHDHFKWQDYVCAMPTNEVDAEFNNAKQIFSEIFGEPARACAAPGWQISPDALKAEDDANLLYASDVRNGDPFFPTMSGQKFKTLQIPTTLPTLDEILGIIPLESVTDSHIAKMKTREVSIITAHAELEGAAYLEWFGSFLDKAKAEGTEFIGMESYAKDLLATPENIDVAEIKMSPFDGRSGLLATRQ